MTPDVRTANSVMDAASLGLDTLTLSSEDVVSGSPVAAGCELLDVTGSSVGLWELTPGVVTDTEVDEVFVVISGHASIEIADEGRVLHLAPGTVGRLAAGTRTRWTVTETLRKVYFMPSTHETVVGR